MFSHDASFSHFEYLLSQSDEHGAGIARFLDALVATSGSRRRRLPKGRILARAQRGYVMREEPDTEMAIPDAFLPERMKPPREGMGELALHQPRPNRFPDCFAPAK